MRKRAVWVGVGALAAFVVAAGCSGGDAGTAQSGGDASSTTSVSSSAQASGQQHNDADVMFAQHMIPHHEQAVEMSDIVLAKPDIDARITDLANKIKAAQGPEITQMRGWLDQWGIPPMPSMDPGMGGMQDHENMPGTSGAMTGMLSAQQMTDLKNANGVDAGKLFLSGMIAHHEGAIAMAQDEIGSGKFAPAIDLAKSIVTTQQQEIDTMKGILATL
ncbi:DUF305 domain-containing protein [Mycolicibacterium moriokaense]|nr:DUF305 domain-containing protein [Mycolicibacterium moriokaense]